MALVLMEGFDLLTASYVNTKYPLGAQFGADMVAGRYSPGQGYRPGPGNQNGSFKFQFAGLTQFTVGVGLQFPLTGMGTGIRFLSFLTAADAVQFCVGADANGAIRVALSAALLSSGPLAVSANNVIASSSWFYCEVEFVLSDTVGECRVWINGALVINLSGIDTKAQAAADVQRMDFIVSGSGAGGLVIDDLYLTNTDSRLGESRIYVLEPTSDSSVQWTRSAGSTNFSCVDEAPFNTSDYVASATVGHQDYYGFANLPYVPAAIHAVQTSMFAAKDDAATRTVRANLDSGGTVANGTDFGLSATYLQKTDLYALDPDTGSAWTSSAVDALIAGPEVRA
jgi:hypothetical protein